MISDIEHMNLRKPYTKETDMITNKIVAQVHSTYNLINITLNNASEKESCIFIKEIAHKMDDGNKGGNLVTIKIKDSKNKKWEPKNKVQL